MEDRDSRGEMVDRSNGFQRSNVYLNLGSDVPLENMIPELLFLDEYKNILIFVKVFDDVACNFIRCNC